MHMLDISRSGMILQTEGDRRRHHHDHHDHQHDERNLSHRPMRRRHWSSRRGPDGHWPRRHRWTETARAGAAVDGRAYGRSEEPAPLARSLARVRRLGETLRELLLKVPFASATVERATPTFRFHIRQSVGSSSSSQRLLGSRICWHPSPPTQPSVPVPGVSPTHTFEQAAAQV
jgi:hypothetical protein